ncbi:hypothetical protein HKX48_006395 [Thoreauomyces humboldtii]|nr:hypothetical protein HKX48_006395 [Thoreauomyces humboldtii]
MEDTATNAAAVVLPLVTALQTVEQTESFSGGYLESRKPFLGMLVRQIGEVVHTI